MSHNILIVESDPLARRLAQAAFDRPGYSTLLAECIEEGADLLSERYTEIDAVVLDIGYPAGSGLDVLGRLRVESDIPALLLTTVHDPGDAVVSFRLGADDYIVKPIEPAELRARVEAVLRRWNAPLRMSGISSVKQFGTLSIDTRAREVRVNGVLIALTAIEFDLLAFLASHPRQVFTRSRLLEKVWDSSAWNSGATVTEHVRRLRAKLAPHASHHEWVCTVRGVGYRFDP